MLVVDASAAVDLVVGPPAVAARVGAALAASRPLAAPELITTEVVSALAGLARARDLTWPEARRALAAFGDVPLRRLDVHPLRERVLDLAQAMSAYDASYVVLAETIDCPLVTTDRRLARAVRTVDVLVPG